MTEDAGVQHFILQPRSRAVSQQTFYTTQSVCVGGGSSRCRNSHAAVQHCQARAAGQQKLQAAWKMDPPPSPPAQTEAYMPHCKLVQCYCLCQGSPVTKVTNSTLLKNTTPPPLPAAATIGMCPPPPQHTHTDRGSHAALLGCPTPRAVCHPAVSSSSGCMLHTPARGACGGRLKLWPRAGTAGRGERLAHGGQSTTCKPEQDRGVGYSTKTGVLGTPPKPQGC
jgi:hypothetical protein